MARHSHRRALKLRRTITPPPAASPGDGAALSRSLWGIAAKDALAALAEQQEAFAAERAAAAQQLAAERARLAELTQQLESQQGRLDSLREVVATLREKLAHERAAKAVLAARLTGRQAEEQKTEQAAAARLESVRLSADIQQEHEALRQLVAALYRSITGRNGVPAGLEPLAELPPAPANAAAAAARRGGVRQVSPWQRYLLGKKAGQALTAPDGRVLIREGETIGPDEIALAEREGLLFALMLTMKVAPRLPDL